MAKYAAQIKCCRLSTNTIRRLEQIAEAEDRTYSNVVRIAIKEYLTKKGYSE